MTRDQARAILANLDLIRHYAAGGDIGHRMINYRGEFLHTDVARHIVLGNLSTDGSHRYVMVKPKYRMDPETGGPVRVERCWPEKIQEGEIIKQNCVDAI